MLNPFKHPDLIKAEVFTELPGSFRDRDGRVFYLDGVVNRGLGERITEMTCTPRPY